jgi:glucose/mannose-6-phosphate isomerase
MDHLIRSFPDQLREALRIAESSSFHPHAQPIRQVLLIGLGGSAFGGEVVRNLVDECGRMPFLISREYDLPAWVGPETLVMVSSYSGNTEETLSAFKQALAKGCKLVCISSGGILIDTAREQGLDYVQLPPGSPPRAAAGYSLVQLANIMARFGALPDLKQDLLEGIELVSAFADHDLARSIAAKLHGRIPVLYSSGRVESASIRWRQQIEENAKQIAFHHVVPEMNHNELVGWKLPADLLSRAAVVLLKSNLDHPRVAFRFGVNKEIIAKCTDCILEVEAKGFSRFAQLLYLIHLGDWVSFYLSEANQVDATPVEVIDFLKNTLAGHS